MLYSFDNFSLNTEERTLKRHKETIALTPKVFDTLVLLVKNHDRVVSKDELLNAIWPERFVEEANLTQNISVLRRALGERASGKKYIATFSGRGYRFLEPLLATEPSPEEFQQGEYAPDPLPEKVPLPARMLMPKYRGLALTGGCAALFLIGTALGFSRLHPRRESQSVAAGDAPALEPTGLVRTAVRMEGAQYQPAWSADGSQLAFAYSSANGSSASIYIQTEGQMHPRLIAGGSGKYSSPVFSPDGRSLAFLHVQPNLAEILIYDLATDKTRHLVTLMPHNYGLNCRQLDWSPAGDFLVVGDKEAANDPLSLYLVFLSNGSKVRLTYPDMDILGDTEPRFSPDGTQIAFIRMKYQYEFDVYLVPVTGGPVRKLTSHSGILGDVDWNTSKQVVYTGYQNGEFRMWQVNVGSASPHPVLASTIATDMPLQFSIARKARQIAFAGYRPDLNVWALDLSKAGEGQAAWKPVIRTPGQDITPFYSPDGKMVAFRSDVSGRLQIWVSRADGSDAKPLSTGSMAPSVMSWAPDSQSLIFCSPSARGIFQVSVSGRFGVRKISNMQASHPLYSVDGQSIFAQAGSFIYRIPVSGGHAQVISDQGGSPIRQSSDGHYVFFGHRRMDTTITRVDLKTGRQEVVVRSLIPGYRDAWALTTKGIYFLTEEAGKPVISFHDFATGSNRKVAAFAGSVPMIATSGFSVSPDGRTLLVVRADPTSASIQTADFSVPEEYATTSAPDGQ